MTTELAKSLDERIEAAQSVNELLDLASMIRFSDGRQVDVVNLRKTWDASVKIFQEIISRTSDVPLSLEFISYVAKYFTRQDGLRDAFVKLARKEFGEIGPLQEKTRSVAQQAFGPFYCETAQICDGIKFKIGEIIRLSNERSYTVKTKLGGGFTSEVYLAIDSVGRDVAIKCAYAYARDKNVGPSCSIIFKQEADILQKLGVAVTKEPEGNFLHRKRENYFPAIFSSIEDAEEGVIVMEAAPDQELLSIRTSGTVLEERVEVWLKVCHAMAIAERTGVIRTDAKMSDVRVDGQGGIKIFDWNVVNLEGEKEKGSAYTLEEARKLQIEILLKWLGRLFGAEASNSLTVDKILIQKYVRDELRWSSILQNVVLEPNEVRNGDAIFGQFKQLVARFNAGELSTTNALYQEAAKMFDANSEEWIDGKESGRRELREEVERAKQHNRRIEIWERLQDKHRGKVLNMQEMQSLKNYMCYMGENFVYFLELIGINRELLSLHFPDYEKADLGMTVAEYIKGKIKKHIRGIGIEETRKLFKKVRKEIQQESISWLDLDVVFKEVYPDLE